MENYINTIGIFAPHKPLIEYLVRSVTTKDDDEKALKGGSAHASAAVSSAISFAIMVLAFWMAYSCNRNDWDWMTVIGVLFFSPIYVVYKFFTCFMTRNN